MYLSSTNNNAIEWVMHSLRGSCEKKNAKNENMRKIMGSNNSHSPANEIDESNKQRVQNSQRENADGHKKEKSRRRVGHCIQQSEDKRKGK